jgi:hypothetical protein
MSSFSREPRRTSGNFQHIDILKELFPEISLKLKEKYIYEWNSTFFNGRLIILVNNSHYTRVEDFLHDYTKNKQFSKIEFNLIFNI